MSAPEHAADVREWLSRALDDLRWAPHSFAGGFLPQARFGCQQGAEKALKSYLLAHDLSLSRTHSLPTLLAKAATIDPHLSRFEDSATVLDAYYAPTRYADVPVKLDYTSARVQDAIQRARALVDELAGPIESRLAGGDAPQETPA
jgi:HEPN domain-containing protein